MDRFLLASGRETFETEAKAKEAMRDVLDTAAQYDWDIDEGDRSATYTDWGLKLISATLRADWEIVDEAEYTHLDARYSIDRKTAYLMMFFPLLLVVWGGIDIGMRYSPIINLGLLLALLLAFGTVSLGVVITSIWLIPFPISDRERSDFQFNLNVSVGVFVVLAGSPLLASIPVGFVTSLSMFSIHWDVVGLLTAGVSTGLLWLVISNGYEQRFFLDVSSLKGSTSDPQCRLKYSRGILHSTRRAAPNQIKAIAKDANIGLNPVVTERDDETLIEGSRKILGVEASYEWTISSLNTDQIADQERTDRPDDRGDGIESGQEGVVVEETIYVADDLRQVLALFPVCMVLIFVGSYDVPLGALGPMVQPLVSGPDGLILALVFFPVSVAGISLILGARTVVKTALNPSKDSVYLERKRFAPTIPLSLIEIFTIVILIGSWLGSTLLIWVGIGGEIMTAVVTMAAYDKLAQGFGTTHLLQEIPTVPIKYMTTMVTLGLIPFFLETELYVTLLEYSEYNPLSTSSTQAVREPAVQLYLVFISVIMTILLVVPSLYDKTDMTSILRFKSRTYSDSPVVRWGVFGATVIVTIGVVLLCLRSVPWYFELLQQQHGVGLAIVLSGLTFLPAGFLVAGIAYQFTGGVLALYYPFTHSSPTKIPGSDEIEPVIRVYDASPSKVFGYTDGVRNVIFVPESCLEALDDPDEIKAVLAHEEAHIIEYTDSIWTTIAPFVSSVLFIARNVLLTALNFREREFRADRYAADKTDPDTLEVALRKLRHAEREYDQSGGSVFETISSPYIVPSDSEGTRIHSRLLDPFYSSFAQSAAHPTLRERIQEVSDSA